MNMLWLKANGKGTGSTAELRAQLTHVINSTVASLSVQNIFFLPYLFWALKSANKRTVKSELINTKQVASVWIIHSVFIIFSVFTAAG